MIDVPATNDPWPTLGLVSPEEHRAFRRRHPPQYMRLKTPFADVLPPLSRDEFAALRADISARGIQDPLLVTDSDEILDGHQRWRIADELGIDAPTNHVRGSRLWTDAEKQAFVFRCNHARRNMSTEQKYEAIKAIASLLRAEQEDMTQKEIAAELGVSQQWVSKWCGQNTTCGNVSTADCRVKIRSRHHREIADRANNGEPLEQIAADYKVVVKTIKRIVNKVNNRDAELKRRREEFAKADPTTLGIHHLDFREAGELVKNESVDLIFTDPPWQEPFMSDGIYRDLGAFAARVLKPGAWCLAYVGHNVVPEAIAQMIEHLE